MLRQRVFGMIFAFMMLMMNVIQSRIAHGGFDPLQDSRWFQVT
jgi:hypothetical protein